MSETCDCHSDDQMPWGDGKCACCGKWLAGCEPEVIEKVKEHAEARTREAGQTEQETDDE